MDEKQQKQLKEILKSEFLPLFVGLRGELKQLNETVTQLYAKEPPEVIKTEVTNPTPPVTEVGVVNLPEIQRVEVVNNPEQPKSIRVNNLETVLEKQIGEVTKGLESAIERVVGRIRDLREGTQKVHVQNPVSFPRSIRISNLDEIEKAEAPTSMRISNSTPSEAIPVVLTNRDRKNFYDAFQQMYVANDVNLERVIKAIEDVSVVINGDIQVDTDYIEELLEKILAELEKKTDVAHVWGQVSVLPLGGEIICSYIVPVGKTFKLKGVTATGDVDSFLHIETDDGTIWWGYTAWTQRTLSAQVEKIFTEGTQIDLWAENRNNVTSGTFNGNFYGDLY